MSSALKVAAAGATDIGQQRSHNEDSFCVADGLHLYVVADGMGGHLAGDVASGMATRSIEAFFQSTAREDATWPVAFDPALTIGENRIIAAIQSANRAIFHASTRNLAMRGMGTTVVAASFAPASGKLHIAHVGDSRAYRIRKRDIVQLTRDHSLYNEFAELLPQLTKHQQEEVPRNVITRALGMQDSVVVDLTVDDPEPGDCYLLCSDGLSSMLTDDQLLRVISKHTGDLDGLADVLIGRANAEGGEDNITAVLVRFSSDRPTALPAAKPKRRKKKVS